MTFAVDRVQHDTRVVAIARLRRGDEVIADLATYPAELASLAAPGIGKLDAALQELAKEIEERELGAPAATPETPAAPLAPRRATSRRRGSSR